MGVQVTLREILGQFASVASSNANITDTETGFNQALDRTDTVDNAMEVDLDLGLNKIINLASTPTADTDAANKKYVDDQVGDSVTAADEAAASAAAALVSENNAAASESAASTSEGNASTSEGNASTSETNAAASAAAALVSEGNALLSETNAADTLVEFNGIYYGPLAGDPALDPNGDAPTEGDLYFNTTLNLLRAYDGAIWVHVLQSAPADAVNVTYDNVGSGATAIETQSALDELFAGKLDATAKAVDSELLDSLNSTQFLRSDVDSTTTAQISGITPTSVAHLTRKDYVDDKVLTKNWVSKWTGSSASVINSWGTGDYLLKTSDNNLLPVSDSLEGTGALIEGGSTYLSVSGDQWSSHYRFAVTDFGVNKITAAGASTFVLIVEVWKAE